MNSALFAMPPFGGAAPTPNQLNAMGSMAAGWGAARRRGVMNEVGALLRIPPGGWSHGLSRLFANNDIRLVGLLRRCLSNRFCRDVSRNLERARRWVNTDLMIVLCTAARENSHSLNASGTRLINTYYEGGLDFLWKEKERLGLPAAVTSRWKPVPEFVNEESGSVVSPAEIPAEDQVLAYAAQINTSFQRNFVTTVRSTLAAEPGSLVSVSRPALLAWKAYAFLAPSGRRYDPARSVAAQSGQPFGHATAVQYLAQRLKGQSPTSVLEGITRELELNHVEWVRIAKARAAEALFMERLWVTSSELLPLGR